jgi:hypothetical protein
MSDGQKLFRKQVIDELSTKLNGEILLKPSISFTRFVMCLIAWLFLMTAIYQNIKINSAKTITGELVLQNDNLVAKFLLPVDLASQIQLGDIIRVQLLGISKTQFFDTAIKVTQIDKSLSVFGVSYLGDDRVTSLKAEAVLVDPAVSIQGQRFSLSEGVMFSFRLNDQPQKLFPWLRHHLFEGE